ncbi:hypothetical protein [Nitrosovibrio tenuis]|uniref:HNH endonuclease n=1 Tax=Nitrosovibrio tenuis TaxID=1233 RepID=A0A1H7NUI3_9PROT|nr:hypothetical protein [Nitrosovibrio tenuis]SEL27233.1 hypothetical protein SAMN05216387_107144 [Nitrosovibrio tenuis]
MNPNISFAPHSASMYKTTDDGSVLDETGKVLYFSVARFVHDICMGNCCFICGASPDSTKFNNEHILPRWLLKRYNLYSRQITLPNLTGYNYGQYVIPCCQNCNALLGRKIEEPLRKLVSEGSAAVNEYVRKEGPWLIFLWQCLIFLKTHLKDKNLPLNRDRRSGNEMIGEIYEWKLLHHIHSVARSIYTGAKLSPEILGSFLLIPAKVHEHFEGFDYGDLYITGSSLLQLDDMCFISVLNDANGALCSLDSTLQKINGPLSPLQTREVFARLSYINLKLKNRPQFFSDFNHPAGYRIIGTRHSHVALLDPRNEEFGQIFYYATSQILAFMENENKEQIEEHVRNGNYTFLFDREGHFIKDSMVRRETNDPHERSH